MHFLINDAFSQSMHSVVQYSKEHQHIDATKSTNLDSFLIIQLDIHQGIIILDILAWNIILYTVTHFVNAFLSFSALCLC